MLTLHQRQRAQEFADTVPAELTAEELMPYRNLHRVTFPVCAGPCDHGRRLCPCPDACQRAAEADDDLACAAGIVRAVVWSAAIYAAGIVAWLLLAR